jgi:formylglycine-generating enzyme required for sulfatase activity
MRSAPLFLALCACSADLEPYGEAVIVVVTDLPVPQVAHRLRVDLHQGERWLESRDVALPDPRDWPPSFSVWSDDTERGTRVAVRVRVYSEGHVRDYLGAPLVRDGVDVTPATEPDPLTAVDRLVVAEIDPGVLGRRRVALRAVCAGTEVDLAAMQSCVGVERTLAPAAAFAVEDGVESGDPVPPSLEGGCDGLGDEQRACIPGGATLLGSSEVVLYPDDPAVPERLVVGRPFLIDRRELTVGDYRALLASGFSPSELPDANEGPLGTTVADTCTWSTADVGREAYALTCLSWQAAREICLHRGGDLPTEAQWERMARLASARGRSRYPWGDEPPSCDRAVYGRLPLGGIDGVCQSMGVGPVPIDAAPADATPQGVLGAAGGVGEWMLDAYESYASACWQASPVTDARCFYEGAALRAVRGGSWAAPPTILQSTIHLGVEAVGRASFVGVRCAYPLPEAA